MRALVRVDAVATQGLMSFGVIRLVSADRRRTILVNLFLDLIDLIRFCFLFFTASVSASIHASIHTFTVSLWRCDKGNGREVCILPIMNFICGHVHFVQFYVHLRMYRRVHRIIEIKRRN